MKSAITSSIQDQPQQSAAPADGTPLPGAFSLFGPSLEAVKLNLGTFVLGAVAPIILAVIPIILVLFSLYSRTQGYLDTHTTSVPAVFNMLAIVFGVLGVIALIFFFIPFMYTLKLQSAKGVKMSFRATFMQSRGYFWRVLRLYFLRSVVIALGFLLLIVPGFFMWRRYMLAPFYLMDQNLGVGEAMRKSASESVPFSSAIWGMIGVYVLISVLGLIPIPFIGSLIGFVMSIIYSCAQAIRYLQIKSAKV